MAVLPVLLILYNSFFKQRCGFGRNRICDEVNYAKKINCNGTSHQIKPFHRVEHQLYFPFLPYEWRIG